jgi:hypothetical protein
MRIRALVLPRLFRQWQRFVALRTRVKAAEANMIILCKRRVFRTVVSKIVLRHVTISNFSQVNGTRHQIHRSLRKWMQNVCEKKRIFTIMTRIQQLDEHTCMRTLIKRWKINSMTSRSLILKESEVKAQHEYRKMCHAIVLWKERTNEIRSFRNNFQIADLFRVCKIRNKSLKVGRTVLPFSFNDEFAQCMHVIRCLNSKHIEHLNGGALNVIFEQGMLQLKK